MLVFVSSSLESGIAPVLPFHFESADDFLTPGGYVVLEQLASDNKTSYKIAHKHNQSKTWEIATGVLVDSKLVPPPDR
jgi:hypothetical protein